MRVGSTEGLSSMSMAKQPPKKPEAAFPGEEMLGKDLGFLVWGFLLISCRALGKPFRFPGPLFLNL